MPQPVRRVTRQEKARILPAAFPNGLGAGQKRAQGPIKVRNQHPLKSRKVSRPGQQQKA
jgi:hypothetical protein